MITGRIRFRWLSRLAPLGPGALAMVLFLTPVRALAQEPSSSAPKPSQSEENNKRQEPGFGQQLAKETREAAGEEED